MPLPQESGTTVFPVVLFEVLLGVPFAVPLFGVLFDPPTVLFDPPAVSELTGAPLELLNKHPGSVSAARARIGIVCRIRAV